MLSNVLALTAVLAATASAFDCSGNYFSFYNRNNALSYQRLDPALTPGAQSSHLHSFDGGNGLTASSSFSEMQASTCSTARIKTDKSLYWRPTLFWNGNGTGFYRVPETNTKIYYKFGDGDKWANVTGFPQDFNMIAGDSMKRADGDNPAGIQWACHDTNSIYTNGFPTGFTSCKDGFATQITFPSCWNGQKLDPKNPDAHMAYPNANNGVGIENCPTTHRAARFPTIFIEFWYDVSSFDGHYGANDKPWVGSNGDPTGFGFHADFLNGWETGVLEKAIAETGGCNCGCGCGQTQMEQCFGAENVNNDSDADFQQCAAQYAYGSSDAAPVQKTLPGCNPIQSGPADATMVTGPNCAATAASGANMTAASTSSSATVTPSATPLGTASQAVKDNISTMPSLTLSEYKHAAKPTSTAASSANDAPGYDVSSLTPVTTATPAGSTSTPSTFPGGQDGECKKPVSITVTPTVYVTASSNSTSCGGTVYKTHHHKVTITVPAHGTAPTDSY